ncbi:MAG: (d)CMP kinase [Gammaproteobacteria bacterium]
MKNKTEQAPVVTIDGPSGTGKGTLAIRLKNRLGWHLLDSGALYRSLGLAAVKSSIPLNDEDKLATLALDLALSFEVGNEQVEVFLNDENISAEIRTEVVGSYASQVAAFPAVRKNLLARQRAFRRPPGLIADGRDMGTVVFPDAEIKIFLTASAEERAQRRHKQLKQKGISVTLAQLLDDICDRDRRDEQRSVSPLRPAPDAIMLDTTLIEINEVENQVMALMKKRGIVIP